MKQYIVKLTGISPLIMHWDNIDWQDQLEKWRSVPENKKKSVAGDDRSPPFTWTGYVYNDGEVIALPFDNLRSCLMDAGKKMPKSKGRGSFKTEAVADLMIDELFLPLEVNGKTIPFSGVTGIDKGFTGSVPFVEHVEAAKKLGFKLLVKRAAVGQSKHIRVRPIFDKWELSVPITVNDGVLTSDSVAELFRVAGRYIGLCDWRPSEKKSPGPYGRFDATVSEVK